MSEDKIFTKSFFLIFISFLFTALVMYALMSTVTEYATSMGSTATLAGLVSGIYLFGGLCSRIYSSNAISKIGWKKTAMIFLTIHFLACLLYFIVDNVDMLLIVRFIHGIGFGASTNAIITIASEILPKKRFAESFGYFMLGTTIAVGVGPYIGGLFYDIYGSVGCFIAASIFSAIALISMIFIKVDEPEKESSINEYKGLEKVIEYRAIPVSLFIAMTSVGYVSILSFYRLYAVEVNLTSAFSWFFIIYSIILVISRPVAGRIQDSYGDRIICVGGIIAQSIGLLLIAVHPSFLTVIICAFSTAVGFGTLNSAGTAIVARNASDERRPYAISTYFIFCDTSVGFGPAFLGLFASNGYVPVYLVACLITFLALPVCIFALGKQT